MNQAAAPPVDDPDLALSDDLDDASQTEKVLVVPEGVWGQRLDRQLALLLPQHSRARLQAWIEAGHVGVNGVVQTKPRHSVSEGDCLQVRMQRVEESLAFAPQNIPLDVLDQGEGWIVLNKPVGLVVHPGAGNWQGTLLNGLLHRFEALAGVPRAGIVHRLDKDTSGLMVVARTLEAQTALVRQLQARSVTREYVALTHGHVPWTTCTVDKPIGRDPRVPVRMTTQRPVAAKEAITEARLEKLGVYLGCPVSLIRCRLQTGRTHQIRVHLASIGHPLVGDPLYGGRLLGMAQRQMLHAERLAFVDPAHGQTLAFECPPPADMQAVLAAAVWSSGFAA